MADRAATGAGGPGQDTKQPKQKKDAATRLAEPWPDAAKIRQRRETAENLPLFKSADPLVFTLTADFKTINRDRTVDSPRRVQGVITVAGPDGKTASIPVQLGSRGNLRLRSSVCAFVPLRVEFPKAELKGTVFDGQGTLKLVTHCENNKEYEQYVLGEYLNYKIFNLFTPLSYRARLVGVTYVDSIGNKTLTTRYGAFIEDDDDVARRVDGRIIPLLDRRFRHLDTEALTLMALLEFMIGNTDFSIIKLHNIRLVQDQPGVFRPITYDFDLAGIINPRYGTPDRLLNLQSLKDRLYRGPCRTVQEYEPFLAKFREKKAEVMALYDSFPDLTKETRTSSKEYLEEFYAIITNPARVKHFLVDRCPKVAGI
jgi:hypothetical protein